MTQIATQQQPSIAQGPRGIGARAVGGAYSQDSQTDLIDADAFQAPPILLSGSTDALAPIINPANSQHGGGNYIVKTAGVDAMTIPTPIAGIDDNLTVAVFSDTANAHTITAASACIAAGVALKTTITFPAFRGAGVILRAMNGTWQIVGQGFTANTLG